MPRKGNQKPIRKATKEEKSYTRRTIKEIRGRTPKSASTSLEENKREAQKRSAGPHVATSGKNNFEESRDLSPRNEGRMDKGRSLSKGKVATRVEEKNVDYLQNTRQGQKLQRVEHRHMIKDVRKGVSNPTQGRHQTDPGHGGNRLRGDSPTIMNTDSASVPMRNRSIDRLNKNKKG
jgi:hypothetical protein